MLDPMPIIPISTEHPRQLPRPDHEHTWSTESRHRVSAGLVLYVRCSRCGARRVDLETAAEFSPARMSSAGVAP